MAWFLGIGIAGVVLLVLSLVFDGVLEGAFGGALDGVFEGWLSLPVVAGFAAMTGFGGAIVLGATEAPPAVATGAGALALAQGAEHRQDGTMTLHPNGFAIMEAEAGVSVSDADPTSAAALG